MNVRVGAATDIGQVREGNEDSYLVDEPLFAVADGMGGHRGGEVASKLALDTIERMFQRREGTLSGQVEEANRAVFERSSLDRRVAGMGTTLTAALLEGDRLRLAHVGDSRAYLLRDGRLHLLTEDHTLVHRMVAAGEISEAEAEVHPHRSILTRALGVDMSIEVDESAVEVRPGDRILLCTDGLTGMLSEERIREVLAATPDPQEAVERLVHEANRAGGIDNITALVVDVSDESRPDRGTEETETSTEHTERPGGLSAGTDAVVVGAPMVEAPRSSVATRERAGVTVRGTRTTAGPGRVTGRRALRAAIGAGAAMSVAVVGVVGLRVYLDAQWYVGVSNGQVAVFRGIPAEVAGFELHHVVAETTIVADVAESLALYRDLEDGITADDRADADAIVDQIRDDVARLQQNATT